MNRYWMKKPIVVWICILLLPPLGLVLVWLRRDCRLYAKIVGSLAALLFAWIHLALFWNFKVEVNGSLSRPLFSFRNSDRHNQEIDKLHQQDHAVDTSQLRPPLNAPAQVAPEKPIPKPVASIPPEVFSNYWTEYRGPERLGIYAEMEIATNWPSNGLPLLWKRPVGGGYASVVVADRTLFTIEQRRQREVVAAYDLDSGREKWIHGWDAEFRETMGGDGPRATPTWQEGRIYALGAAGELRCLDAGSGNRIWSHNILSENQSENLEWGMAASPLIVDDKIIVLTGNSVVAYGKSNGNLVWKALKDRQSYTAPQLVTLAGRRQILSVGANRAVGLSIEDGKLLWESQWSTYQGINAAQPIVTGPNRFFLSAGYGHGAASIEIIAHGESFEARTVWANNRMKNKFSSSVLYQGFIYGLDEAILACMDASTGELKWKGGRYGSGELLLASGHLVLLSESGEVALVKASPDKYEELARFQAIEGKTWNVPAIADGRLIIRNATEMACFRIGKSK
jgi:outer membrane protein assembly factor BamB